MNTIKEITDRLQKIKERTMSKTLYISIYYDGSGCIYGDYLNQNLLLQFFSGDNPLEKIDEYLNELKTGDEVFYLNSRVRLLDSPAPKIWNFVYLSNGIHSWGSSDNFKKIPG